jgi:uncharacterized membrane protein (UPF0127 family)
LVALLQILAVACGSDGASDVPAKDTPTPLASTVTFESRAGESFSLAVEIADAPEERSHGLMGRDTLPGDAGMLFVWPEDASASFWMKDTLIPLSIAFIDAAGKIIDIQDMQPMDETLRYGPGPYRYAVEANQGWFAENGIAVGDAVRLPESVATQGG